MKHFAIVLIMVLIPLLSFSQAPKVQNLKSFDTKKWHLGMQVGANSGGFALHRKMKSPTKDSLAAIDVTSQNGFHLGIVTDLHLNKYFHLRFIPGYIFGQRNVTFNFINKLNETIVIERVIESSYIDLPLLLKYRSARLNNFAAYFIVGYKYSIDLASNEQVDNDDISQSILKLKKHTTSAEIGVGTDFFLPFVKFSIEMKMAYGLQDALINDNTELSNSIEKLIPKMFFFTFLIEG